MRKKQLLTYGLLAGVGYMIYKQMQTTVAPAVVVAPVVPAVAGFGGAAGMGRLGYFPDGSDRPFAQHQGQYWRGRSR